MLHDQIKVYQNYEHFKSCPFCTTPTHFMTKCQKINFVPDKDFLIKKCSKTEKFSKERTSKQKCPL